MFHVEHSPKIGKPYDRWQHLMPCWLPHGMFRVTGLGIGAGWIFMFHVEHDATRILGVRSAGLFLLDVSRGTSRRSLSEAEYVYTLRRSLTCPMFHVKHRWT